MTETFFASLLLGAVSGISAGLFGIGGGIIIVPVLVFLFTRQGFAPDLIMIMSVATSLATIICTSISSVRTHHSLGNVVWHKVFRLAPGIVIGAIIGAIVADHMPKEILRLVFVTYLLYTATHMALASKPQPGRGQSSRFLDAVAGMMTGALSAIIGIGGGTLVVPYLVYFQMPIRNAVAVASACGLPIALTSTVSYALLGQSAHALPTWSLGYVYLPAFCGIALTSVITAPWGAHWANKIPAQRLKRYFALLLFVMAAKLLWPYKASFIGNITTLLHSSFWHDSMPALF